MNQAIRPCLGILHCIPLVRKVCMLFFYKMITELNGIYIQAVRYCFTGCQTCYKRETDIPIQKKIQVNNFCQLKVVLQIEAHMCLTRFRDISRMEKLSLKALLFITNGRPCTVLHMAWQGHPMLFFQTISSF